LPGSNPNQERTVIQADTTNSTRRRDFLALTAAVATTVMAARPALANLPDDSALLALEAAVASS
jgi:hypothetical protein